MWKEYEEEKDIIWFFQELRTEGLKLYWSPGNLKWEI
jgi:hypothetical protein